MTRTPSGPVSLRRAGDFLWRADEAANAGGEAHASKQLDLAGRVAIKADGVDLRRVHAGEHGHGEQLGWVGKAFKSGVGCCEHCGAAESVKGEHVDAERSGGPHGSCDGVGNVVKFEIEENGVALVKQWFNDCRTRSNEELEADLEPCAGSFQAVNEFCRCLR